MPRSRSQSAIARSRSTRSPPYAERSNDRDRHPGRARALERQRLGIVGGDRDDLDALRAVHLIEQRLQIRAGARKRARRPSTTCLRSSGLSVRAVPAHDDQRQLDALERELAAGFLGAGERVVAAEAGVAVRARARPRTAS